MLSSIFNYASGLYVRHNLDPAYRNIFEEYVNN